MKKYAIFTVAVASVAPCSCVPGDPYLSDSRGQLPLSERQGAEEVQLALRSALTDVRRDIREELTSGTTWDIEDKPNSPGACGGEAVDIARIDSGIGGLMRGFEPQKKDAAIEILGEHVKPLGYTIEIVSSSGEMTTFHNPLTDGYVDIRLTQKNDLGLSYSTGCHRVMGSQG